MLAGLGIIWFAFLIPAGIRLTSPASSVEEFERRMDLLAETNGAPRGRWVLMPRKGERFVGPQERNRARVRRRRRQVFTVLIEATALTLLIGLFPPLRPMLIGTMLLGVMLLLYTGLLVKLRADEVKRARIRRARLAAGGVAFDRVPVAHVRRAAAATGHAANGHAKQLDVDELYESGVRVLDDDVHVVVHRSGDLDVEVLQAMAR